MSMLRGRVGGRLLTAVAALVAVIPVRAGMAQVDSLRQLSLRLRQIDETYRLAVPEDQPIADRLLLDYGGQVRFGLVASDNLLGQTRTLRQTDAIFYVRSELDGAHRFFGRLRLLYNDFNSGDSFDGRGDRLEAPIGDRYWYQFDLRGAHLAATGERLDGNLNVRAGRQYVNWASGLALSEVLYAALVDVEWKGFGFTGLAGLTPSTGTIDFDGSRPGFDTDTDRAYFGAMLDYRDWQHHRPYAFVLLQRDHNDRNAAVFETPIFDYPTRFRYDSEYWAIGSRGSLGRHWTYRAELIYQSGRGLSNSFDDRTGIPVEQTEEDVQAWAGVLSLSRPFRDEWDSRFEIEFAGASGDKDRVDATNTFGGNRGQTVDRGFNALGYINTGLVLAPELSNLLMLRAGFSTSPRGSSVRRDWMRLGVNGFLFAKANQSSPINFPTTSGTFLGGELDFLLDWRVTSDLTLTLRYGIFLPGDALPDLIDDPRHFVYGGVTYAF